MLPPLAGNSSDIEASRNAEEDLQQGVTAGTKSEGGFVHVARAGHVTNDGQRLEEKAQTGANGTEGTTRGFVYVLNI